MTDEYMAEGLSAAERAERVLFGSERGSHRPGGEERDLYAVTKASLVRAIEAAERDARAMAGWQSIATAPKDGTKVDLWHPTKGRCADAFWHRQTSTLYDPSCWSNQWWGRIVGATHWMPVPTSPVPRPHHSAQK
jgi:hypothetical protein